MKFLIIFLMTVLNLYANEPAPQEEIVQVLTVSGSETAYSETEGTETTPVKSETHEIGEVKAQEINEEILKGKYESGFEQLKQGHYGEAKPLFMDLSRLSSENSRYRLLSEEFLKLIDYHLLLSEKKTEKKSIWKKDGIIPISLTNTAFGVWSGIYANVIFEVEGRYIFLLPMITTAAAFFGTYKNFEKMEINRGKALLVPSAAVWGTLNGMFIIGIRSTNSEPDTTNIAQPPAATVEMTAEQKAAELAKQNASGTEETGMGTREKEDISIVFFSGVLPVLGAEFLLDKEQKEGDIASMNSGGIWFLISSLLLEKNIIKSRYIDEYFFLAGMDAGLIAGYMFAQQFPVSRARAALLDIGGVIGGLTTTGTIYLILGENHSAKFFSSIALAGIWGGILSAFYFSGNLTTGNDEEAPVSKAEFLKPYIDFDSNGNAYYGLNLLNISF